MRYTIHPFFEGLTHLLETIIVRCENDNSHEIVLHGFLHGLVGGVEEQLSTIAME